MSSTTTSWEQHRKAMLDETSRFIEWGLAHPELVEWIPCKPAGQGGFPRKVGEWFWLTVLSNEDDGVLGRWRGRLRRLADAAWGK